ncbi:MAG: DUF4271 domain-containing protein [Bacteroidota bacterium]
MDAISRSVSNWDWITLILFVGLVIITVGKYFFKASFFSFVALPFNRKYLTINKKKGRLFNGFHILLTVFQVLNISLFLFLTRSYAQGEDPDASPYLFWVVLALLCIYLLIKIILQLGNGYFFENSPLMMNLIFEKLSYFNYSGILAFVGNLLLIYIFHNYLPVAYTVILLILVINGIGLTNIFRNHQKLIVPNIFYFILYLCTLEIAPLVIFISFLNS